MEKPTKTGRMNNLFNQNKLLLGSFLIAGVIATASYIYVAPKSYKNQCYVAISQNVGKAEGNNSIIARKLVSHPFVSKALVGKGLNIRYFQTSDFRTTEDQNTAPYRVSYKILNPKFYSGTYQVRFTGGNNFELVSDFHGSERVKQGQFGQEIIANNIAVTLTKNTPTYHPESLITGTDYSFQVLTDDAVADAVINEGKGLQSAEKNGLIELTCFNDSPSKSKKILDAIYNNYSSVITASKAEEVKGDIQKIDESIDYIAQELSTSEAEIAQYKTDNNLVDISQNTGALLSMKNDLLMQRNTLQMQMASLDNLSNYLRKNRDGNNSLVEYDAIEDPAFRSDIEKLNAKYSSGSTEADPSTEALKSSIAERILNTRKKIAVKLDEINKRVYDNRASLSILPEQENIIADMTRKWSMKKRVFDELVDKRANTIIAATLPANTISLIDPAIFPTSPVSPNIPYTASLIIGSFLFLGLVISYIRTVKKTQVIHHRVEIEKNSEIPYIGHISFNRNPEQVDSHSFMNLCTKLLLKPEAKIITIASTARGEGKTFVARNLAKNLAAMDKKVLLVDMNIYDPEIASAFGIEEHFTLADVLEKSIDVHEAICITNNPNLDVLTAGSLKSGINSVLSSKNTQNILKQLRDHYDMIIIDTPEAGTYIDAVPMMKFSDLTFYVVRSNTSASTLANADVIKQDYGIENMYYILNSISGKLSHTGITNRGSYHKPSVKSKGDVEVQEKPYILRKIALWFY